MVPFDVVASGDCVISNSGGVTHLRKGFKIERLSILKPLRNRGLAHALFPNAWRRLHLTLSMGISEEIEDAKITTEKTKISRLKKKSVIDHNSSD